MCQMKICELERKLQEEKRERKLLQDKANQVFYVIYCYICALIVVSFCNVGYKVTESLVGCHLLYIYCFSTCT